MLEVVRRKVKKTSFFADVTIRTAQLAMFPVSQTNMVFRYAHVHLL